MDGTLYNTIPQLALESELLLLQELYMKGDDVQKLSVIQALPQLLQHDHNATLTRIVPRIQQELPKSSCEFHIATSKIFKLLIEKQLPLNLTGAVIQGTESKDPVVSNAWIETLLSVIPILPIDQIKASVVPVALTKSQPSSPVYCRVASCKILGKCASHPHMQSIDVKSSVLPAVQSLCQDVFQDVRATMCAQLPFIAQGLGENLVKTSLLPSLVELASDDNMAVRSAAVASSVLIIPYLNKQTKIETIVPLIKQLCSKTAGPSDATYPTIAREFGKLVKALQNDLEVSDSVWILQFFKTIATKGQTVRVNKDNLEVTQDVVCREQCALNLPQVTTFTMARIPNQLELWHSVFSGLANDSCYLVRKTTAACIFEVAKILGPQCKVLKDDLIKVLRDDAEEVLQMLVPHVGATLELLCTHGLLSRETAVPACLEITRALLKCQLELTKCYNWRIKSNFLQQLECLPSCMPSDFIHQHFSPVILNCVLESRPRPVRSQASRTLLIFLRYNIKEIQRKWIRDNLVTHLCYSKSCYTRHIFVLACAHASELFSNSYFKKYFFEPLLSLSDDPVCNIRLVVVALLPVLYRMLILPEDKKLQTNIDNIFSKLDMVEKDRDVKDILRMKLKEIRTAGPSNKQDYLADQKRKEEEETKIAQGKITTPASATPGKPAAAAQVAASQGPRGEPAARSPVISRSTTSTASPRVTKSPSTNSGSAPGPSDMSFLEQHFYIDAGVSLPRHNIGMCFKESKDQDVCEIAETFDKEMNLTPIVEIKDGPSFIPTLSMENVNIETMLESELKKLETSTTNITDDVKVNLRKRSKRNLTKSQASISSLTPPKDTSWGNVKYKRYSSVLPSSSTETVTVSTINKKTLNRRSLNINVNDGSRIPVCIKKSQSNTEIKPEVKSEEASSVGETSRKLRYSGLYKRYDPQSSNNVKNKPRPKSEVLMINKCGSGKIDTITSNNNSNDGQAQSIAINDSIIENDVPVANSISSKTVKTSGLPVLKRKTQSEVKSK